MSDCECVHVCVSVSVSVSVWHRHYHIGTGATSLRIITTLNIGTASLGVITPIMSQQTSKHAEVRGTDSPQRER